MRYSFIVPAILLVAATGVRAQEKLDTKGFGSLSGTVTLNGKIPDVIDLTKRMKDHSDWACCLDKKATPVEKIDMTWLVDPKTKGVANVMIWVKAPAGKYLEVHPKFQNRKEVVTIDQPHCAFLPRIAGYNPVQYDENGKLVKSGVKLLLKNSSVVPHNIRAVGDGKNNTGFNETLPGKTELEKTLNPQRLPVPLMCDFHKWMSAHLFVFDHPYFTLTKEDGTFEIPFVPAGAEVTLMAWHEFPGWVLTTKGIPGKSATIQAGKATKLDLTIDAPK